MEAGALRIFVAGATGTLRRRLVPRRVGRLAVGDAGISLMTEAGGASHAKAKPELAWQPAYPSWREGFCTGLG